MYITPDWALRRDTILSKDSWKFVIFFFEGERNESLINWRTRLMWAITNRDLLEHSMKGETGWFLMKGIAKDSPSLTSVGMKIFHTVGKNQPTTLWTNSPGEMWGRLGECRQTWGLTNSSLWKPEEVTSISNPIPTSPFLTCVDIQTFSTSFVSLFRTGLPLRLLRQWAESKLLFQKTGVELPAPTSGSSQLSVTPALRYPTFLASRDICITHTYPHTDTYTYK